MSGIKKINEVYILQVDRFAVDQFALYALQCGDFTLAHTLLTNTYASQEMATEIIRRSISNQGVYEELTPEDSMEPVAETRDIKQASAESPNVPESTDN